MHSEKALGHLVEEMMASSNRILEYSRNRSATGLHRERVVEAYIRKIAPGAFDICSGFVYGESESSKQVDLLVYDHLNYSPLFDEGGYKILMPDCVRLAIEVKSKLNKKAIGDSFENIASVTRLCPKARGLIFGFDGLSLKKTFEHIEDYARGLEPEAAKQMTDLFPISIVSLGNWVITRVRIEEGVRFVKLSDVSFAEKFRQLFSSIFYPLYTYRKQQMHPEALPTLRQQGFKTEISGTGAYIDITYKE